VCRWVHRRPTQLTELSIVVPEGVMKRKNYLNLEKNKIVFGRVSENGTNRNSHSFYFEKTTTLGINKLRVHINDINYSNITLRNSNFSIKNIMFTMCECDSNFFYYHEKLTIFSHLR